MFRNEALRSLVIAFRGTEQVKWKDLVTDLSFQPAPFNPERVFQRTNSSTLLTDAPEVNSSFPPCYQCIHQDSLWQTHQVPGAVML